MQISKRLRVISDLIPDNSFFLDIGCDHALLDVYTVINKKNTKAIASDINKGPLKGAKENIKKYKVENKVKIKQGNGLESYEKGIDTVILSGLGSYTIIDILKERKKVLNGIRRLIISSNNNYYYLRKEITKLGFFIKEEKIVFDKGKYYPILVLEKGKEKYNNFKLRYGPVLMKKKDETFIKYIIEEKNKLIRINDNLKKKHILKKIKIKAEIKRINAILK